MKWIAAEHFIKMIWLWTLANFTRVNSTKNNVRYHVLNDKSSNERPVTLQDIPTNHNQMMKIHIVNVATSSITLQWTLQGEHVENKTRIGSKVEYFLKNGKFSSHMLPPHLDTFVCENLQPSTQYTICVSVYLQKPLFLNEKNPGDVSKCIITDTIPLIRRDSLFILLVFISYYFLMGSIGFCQWKRRCYQVKSKNRRNESIENEAAPNLGNNSTTSIRYREERQKLTNPGCSIEENHNSQLRE